MKTCPNCNEKFNYIQDSTMWNRYHCFSCNYDTHPAIRLLNQYRYYRNKGYICKDARINAYKDIEVRKG